MKAMIIGAAGFVGPYLAEAIQKRLFCEVVITKLPNEITNIPNAREVSLNILDKSQIVVQVSLQNKNEY